MTDKGDRVHRLLTDPDLQQAFIDVRDAILDRFSKTPPSNTEQLVECRRLLQLLESVEANLKRAVSDGKLEDFRVQQDERPPFLGDLHGRATN